MESFAGGNAAYMRYTTYTLFGLLLVGSLWTNPDNATSAFVALGLAGLALGCLELVRVFLYMTPISVIFDIVRIARYDGVRGGPLVFVYVAIIAIKLLATYFAYQVTQDYSEAGASGRYQGFDGAAPPHDPFANQYRPQYSGQEAPPEQNKPTGV